MIGKWMEDTEHDSQTILKQYKVNSMYKVIFIYLGVLQFTNSVCGFPCIKLYLL